MWIYLLPSSLPLLPFPLFLRCFKGPNLTLGNWSLPPRSTRVSWVESVLLSPSPVPRRTPSHPCLPRVSGANPLPSSYPDSRRSLQIRVPLVRHTPVVILGCLMTFFGVSTHGFPTLKSTNVTLVCNLLWLSVRLIEDKRKLGNLLQFLLQIQPLITQKWWIVNGYRNKLRLSV